MTAPTTSKSSNATEMLRDIARAARLDYRPEPFRVYKAQKGAGSALKVDLRLEPVWLTSDKGTDYIDHVDGGLWVDIVAEQGTNAKGDPQFAWKDKALRVSAKLGLPDISALLVGMREVRVRGKKVPDSIAPRRKDKTTNTWVVTDESKTTVGMTHKFNDKTTIITYKFEETGGYLHISESKDKKRSIKLTLAEEVQFQAVLSHAMHMFLKVGL